MSTNETAWWKWSFSPLALADKKGRKKPAPKCVALSGIFAGKVFQPGSDAYASSLASYFSLQQSEVTPRCLFVPETSQDVSLALGALTSASTAHHSCDFAVRSGGFSYYAGASNIADGVTIDLRQLSHIDLRSDHSLVSVGPGATWASVYAYLDPLNLTVAGGRDADVGVGGLTLSGGISYLGPRYGWACDTVQDFEIVLANATILHANHRENANLFWALRGGSNNFGIVTSISFRPVELESGLLWGGFIEYDASTADEQIAAFVNFSQPETYDEYSSLITTFSYASAIHGSILSTNLEYTRPVVNPPVFQAISSIPSLTSTMRVTNMTDLSAESQKLQAAGSRQVLNFSLRPLGVLKSLQVLQILMHSSSFRCLLGRHPPRSPFDPQWRP